MSDFKFSDLGRVQWGPTIKVGLARGFFSGLVLAILISLSGGPANESAGTVFAIPFFWMIFGIPFALGIRLMATIAGAVGVPVMEAMMLITNSLFICIGDPIVYFINRSKPELFGVADFNFFNFVPMMFILNPD